MLFSDGICGRHLQIMVRTRGLGRALDRVIGRALGRDDRHDFDDALRIKLIPIAL